MMKERKKEHMIFVHQVWSNNDLCLGKRAVIRSTISIEFRYKNYYKN
jgi:hypothetical protein